MDRRKLARFDIDVSLADDRWKTLLDFKKIARVSIAAATEYADNLPENEFELSVVFSNDIAVAHLNGQWRSIEKPTNVLSFPVAPLSGQVVPEPLGDVIVALETCQREAQEAGISLENHTVHLLVHGFLHLLGYDHESESDADTMETLEIRILASLNIANPYLDDGSDLREIRDE